MRGSFFGSLFGGEHRYGSVSYTHLDVYKRQVYFVNLVEQFVNFRDIALFGAPNVEFFHK